MKDPLSSTDKRWSSTRVDRKDWSDNDRTSTYNRSSASEYEEQMIAPRCHRKIARRRPARVDSFGGHRMDLPPKPTAAIQDLYAPFLETPSDDSDGSGAPVRTADGLTTLTRKGDVSHNGTISERHQINDTFGLCATIGSLFQRRGPFAAPEDGRLGPASISRGSRLEVPIGGSVSLTRGHSPLLTACS